MKKILFASTALVASAGFAAAEISFSGEAGIGMTFVDGRFDAGADGLPGTADDINLDDWQLNHYVTLSVSMTGETDGGLSFGADFDITTSAAGGAVDSSSAYIEGGFGKLSAGDVDNAVQAVTGLADIGYSGLGTDDVAEGLRGDSAANLLYQGTFGDFSVAASYAFGGVSGVSNDWAVGAKYAMGDYSFALAFDEAAGVNSVHAQVGAGFGDISLAALYSTVTTSGIDIDTYGVTAAYSMGAATVTAAYSAIDVGGSTGEGFGLGVSYDLGGGASVDAGVAEIGGVTVADLGIIMTF